MFGERNVQGVPPSAPARRLAVQYALLIAPLVACGPWGNAIADTQTVEIEGARLPYCERNANVFSLACNGSGNFIYSPAPRASRDANMNNDLGARQNWPAPAPIQAAPIATPPPAQSDSAINRCEATVNPVIIATGEKFLDQSDASSGGLYGMSVDRTYRSVNATGVLFGPNWTSSLDPMRVTPSTPCVNNGQGCYPLTATLTLPSGAKYKYTWKSPYTRYPGEYQSRGSAAMGTLSTGGPGTGWQLEMNDRVYYFDTSGRETRVADTAGQTLATYNGGALATVTNKVGQSFTFTWAGSRVSQVTDPAGNAWTYGYNASSMLATVTSPGPLPDVRTYHYEHADPTLLTGMSINGVRYSTYSYHADKKVAVSGLAGGEARDTFVYGTNATTVTNELGQATTYNFSVDTATGTRRLTGISRAGTATCAAAAASSVYDAAGYVDYKLDWNNNKTDYTYDRSGRLTAAATAAGTAVTSTVEYAWNGTKLGLATYKGSDNVAYASATYTYFTSGFEIDSPKSVVWRDLKSGSPPRTTNYSYTFHPSGARASVTESRSLPGADFANTTVAYDTLGNQVSVTNALGQQASWSNYNGLGLAGRFTDLNGVISTFDYDATGKLKSSTTYLPSGARTTSYTYNNNGQVTDVVYPTGAVSRFRYNAAARLVSVGNALGEFVSLELDVPANTTRARSARNVPAQGSSVPVAVAGGVSSSAAPSSTACAGPGS